MQLPAPLPLSGAAAGRRPKPLPLAVAISSSVLVGFGCAKSPPAETGAIPAPPAPPGSASPTEATKPRTDGSTAAGLQPLPSPQQVITSVPLGRRDPFGQLLTMPATGKVAGGQQEQRGAETATRASSATGGAARPAPDGSAARSTSASGSSQGPATGTAPASRIGRTPAQPLQPPQNFTITGVIRSGGSTEAVVTYGDRSGSLRRGDRGGRTTDLLPSGWSVASVDVDQGQLTLQKDSRKVKVRL